MMHISRSTIVKYIVSFLVMLTFFWKESIADVPFVSEGLETLRFIALVYVFLQSVIIFYRIKNDIGVKKYDNITAAVSNAFLIVCYLSFFFLFLKYNGLSPIQFFTSISIVAAAIAIISKEYLNSIISGFFISFTKIINIDDYISVGEIRGRVKEIKLTKLFLENDQGELIILGNEKVFLSDIVNHSKSNKRRVSFVFELPPAQSYNIEELEMALKESLSEFDDQIKADSFYLRVDNILIDKICFSLFYTLEKLEPEIEKNIRRKTIRNLIKFIHSKYAPT